MPEVIFIKYPDGYKGVKYDSHDSLGDEVIDYYTIKEISEKELENIKVCTHEKLQIILSLYI